MLLYLVLIEVSCTLNRKAIKKYYETMILPLLAILKWRFHKNHYRLTFLVLQNDAHACIVQVLTLDFAYFKSFRSIRLKE